MIFLMIILSLKVSTGLIKNYIFKVGGKIHFYYDILFCFFTFFFFFFEALQMKQLKVRVCHSCSCQLGVSSLIFLRHIAFNLTALQIKAIAAQVLSLGPTPFS